MIDILGVQKDGLIVGQLLEKIIKQIEERIDGVYYRGFPILSTSEGGVTLDGVLCTENHGVTIFHFIDDKSQINDDLVETVDEIHLKIQARLAEITELTYKRQLVVPITSIVYAPQLNLDILTEYDESLLLSRNAEQLIENIQSAVFKFPELLKSVLSRLQSLTSLKNRKNRPPVKIDGSKGSVLKKLEKTLATLDVNQTKAVLENINGVQRIRGLAGSGKTIVLARKIAHIHSQNPHWKIAVTFNSRSLKKQLIRLIEVFYEDANNEKPDWSKVKIIHAWGSSSNPGIYFNACEHFNLPYFDFSSARSRSSYEGAFQFACEELLSNNLEIQNDALYDLILIDEAQDFDRSFLKVCYELLDHNKRLIYAYDELQNLGDSSMPSPEEIWGHDDNDMPLVKFTEDTQDIILNVCYRNPGPILTTAHALGFGVYREPMIQMFDYGELWQEIGYEVISGEPSSGTEVVLSRTNESSPALLSGHNSHNDMIQFTGFFNRTSEYEWVANQIIKNIQEEEILPSDIVVIHPDTKRMRSEVGIIRDILFSNSINSSIAGITGSPDEFFHDDQVTFTSIYRTKGNEAAMVYIIGAQYCNSDFQLAKRRNILFTAMTRTKAWLRVSGVGPAFESLQKEYEKVKEKDFTLDFKYPTEEEREKMKVVNRDMTYAERSRVNQARKEAKSLEKLLGGEVNIADIPDEIRLALIKKLGG